MSNLTIIIILAVVIIVMSIITAFGKAVGAGANVSDLFPEEADGKKVHETKKGTGWNGASLRGVASKKSGNASTIIGTI